MKFGWFMPLFVGLVSCGGSDSRVQPSSQPSESGEQAVRTVTIVGINDFHGGLYEQTVRGDETMRAGGLPWLAGAIEALRAEVPDLLLLDGGDLFQGSWPVNATLGMGSIEAYNLLGVDAASVGNHEFDYGPTPDGTGHPLRGALYAAAEAADFAWLAANVLEVDDGAGLTPWAPPGIEPWTVIERNGVRLGIIGLTTVDTPQTTLARNVVDLRFDDPVETVRRALFELAPQSVDAVVIVGHITGTCVVEFETGATDDPCFEQTEIGRLMTELPEGSIDVIVAGHEHQLVSGRYGKTFVIEAMSHSRAINRLDLVVGPDGVDVEASVLHEPWVLVHEPADPGCDGGTYPMEAREVGGHRLEPSAAAVELIAGLEARAGSLCEELGCAASVLERSRETESAVGNLTADASLVAFPDADLGVQNSGGLRADIPAGIVRREQLQSVMPFENRLLLVELTGEQVEMLFRIGTSGAHGILQIAGGRVHFDPERQGGSDLDGDGEVAAWENDRLCQVWVGGEPLDPERTYRVAINDFLVGGGDHLGHVFEHATVVEEGPLVRDVLYSYVQARDECLQAAAPLVDPAAPRVEQGPCSR